MDHISSLFGDTTKKVINPSKSRNTERGDLMEYFLSQLNPRRAAAGYPPLNYARLGRELKGKSNQFLYYLKRVCDESNNWSATFWTTLNPDKYGKKMHTS